MYLLSSKVTVYTDHQTLVLSFIPYLKSDNRVSDVLSRALVPASGQYLLNVTLEHKPGSDNRVSDVLSRAPVPEVSQVEVAEEELVMSKIRNVQRSDDEKVYRLFRGD